MKVWVMIMDVYDYSTGNLTFDVRPSNWENRTTLSGWTIPGIYSGTTDGEIAYVKISDIHFDNGNEDIHLDITDHINTIISGGTANYGMGLAFLPIYEQVSSLTDQSVAFFTKYTQTFFEPFIETVFADRIDDNRENFYIDAIRNLYLYVNYMGNAYDLDELPTVDVLN